MRKVIKEERKFIEEGKKEGRKEGRNKGRKEEREGEKKGRKKGGRKEVYQGRRRKVGYQGR
jgi:hypothetical protein